jgi:hypothetical protein
LIDSATIKIPVWRQLKFLDLVGASGRSKFGTCNGLKPANSTTGHIAEIGGLKMQKTVSMKIRFGG